MRRWSIALILFLLPAAASAHPGKTDLYGGHKCYKGCENWGLLYAEYHLHDKDGKAIRVAKKKTPRKPASEAVDEAAPPLMETPPESAPQPAPPMSHGGIVPQGRWSIPDPLLLILLALLLLLFLVRKRRTEGSR